MPEQATAILGESPIAPSNCTGQPDRRVTPKRSYISPSDTCHLLLPITENSHQAAAGLSQLVFFFLLPLHFQTHFKDLTLTVQVQNQSECTSICNLHSLPVPYPAAVRKIISFLLRETPRLGAPGTAHPSSSRIQGNTKHVVIYSGNPPLAAKLREILKGNHSLQ